MRVIFEEVEFSQVWVVWKRLPTPAVVCSSFIHHMCWGCVCSGTVLTGCWEQGLMIHCPWPLEWPSSYCLWKIILTLPTRSLFGCIPTEVDNSVSAQAFWTLVENYGPSGPSQVAQVKNPPTNARRHKRREFDPWVKKVPWSKKWQPASVFLPGESHGMRSLAGYSPWGRKEPDTTEWLSMHMFMDLLSS